MVALNWPEWKRFSRRRVYLLGVYIGDRLARLHALRGSEATDVLHQPLQLLVINVALHNTASLQPAGQAGPFLALPFCAVADQARLPGPALWPVCHVAV
ncbi:MAG: hypothetical protein FRX49_00084 [Trebouxia sp. A1-2]|nr:MAG: hypothetical protein FRX49_00084 [Trebouxia sp. A1-2]